MTQPFKHGTTAIFNVQTGVYTPTPIGECKPSEVDLCEHEELRWWNSELNRGDGDWDMPDPEPTELQKKIMNALAWNEALHEELEEIYNKVSKL